MPRLRPEVLFHDGKLNFHAWFAEMGEGACCEGERSCARLSPPNGESIVAQHNVKKEANEPLQR